MEHTLEEKRHILEATLYSATKVALDGNKIPEDELGGLAANLGLAIHDVRHGPISSIDASWSIGRGPDYKTMFGRDYDIFSVDYFGPDYTEERLKDLQMMEKVTDHYMNLQKILNGAPQGVALGLAALEVIREA